ncbi:MAG TPA: triphosphoribosyl-dephospho-CoA synthase [Methanothrix sp.]|nr:triphosphoribosyl-dephospho-CoA synthase [Methanothrix sp.]
MKCESCFGPERVAQCGVLAMLFELSTSPKPGNVDRCHDFSDIGFQHFLTSAVSAYPVFYRAAEERGTARAGQLILEGVRAWQTWDLKSNTHFGSLVLMIPIAMAAGNMGRMDESDDVDDDERGDECGHVAGEGLKNELKSEMDDERKNGHKSDLYCDLQSGLAEVLNGTTVDDSIDFYRAFGLAQARVADVDSFSLNDMGARDWQSALRESNKSLMELMRLSAGHDLIAREWSTGYERTFRLALRLAEQIDRWGYNDGIVRTFLEALAEVPDSLISAKFGRDASEEVSRLAGEALMDCTLDRARVLDRDLLERDINPGSTADLIAASLFISLLMGLRF